MPLERHRAFLALGAVQRGLRNRRGLGLDGLCNLVRSRGTKVAFSQVRELEYIGVAAWARRLACLEALGAEVQFLVLTPEDVLHVEVGEFTHLDGTPVTVSVKRRKVGVDEYFLTDTELGDALAGPWTADTLVNFFLEVVNGEQDNLLRQPRRQDTLAGQPDREAPDRNNP